MTNNEAIILLQNLEDALGSYCGLNEEGKTAFRMAIESLELFGNSEQLPSAQPEPKEIGYGECANALLKMWMDNVLTDGEYNRIMDKLNKHWGIWERKDE